MAPHGLHSDRAPAARAGEEEGASFQRTGRSPAPCSSVATRELGRPHSASNAVGQMRKVSALAPLGPAAESGSAWVGLLTLFDLLMPTRPQLAERSRGGADGSASVEVEGSPPSTLGLGGHVDASSRPLAFAAAYRLARQRARSTSATTRTATATETPSL